MSTEQLSKTPLHALHLELGARMVPFAGYDMPVQYPLGVMKEHQHTREQAGLFDVSHMGQIRLTGANAASALETLVPVDIVDLPVGMQRYALFLHDKGGVMDDLMVANFGDGRLFVVVNAACKAQDIAHMQQHLSGRCKVEVLADRALLALQGPAAGAVMARLAPETANMVFMNTATVTLVGAECYISRSGYTGEDGFEISVPGEHAEALARALLAEPEVKPVGLGARNSLRLEAGLCLYGNDIDTTTSPVEAALNWAMQKVRLSVGGLECGLQVAVRVLAQLDGTQALPRKRVGLIALERVPVREHTVLQSADGQAIGEVTSGLLGPSADQPVAMGYVHPAHAAVGTRVVAIVRGKPVPMEVSAMPFVPNRYHRG